MLPRRIRIISSQSLRWPLRTRDTLFIAQRRWQSSQPSYEPPRPPPAEQASNPHSDYYKSWGIPFAKLFLGAILTFQVIYWSWLKLESLELKHDREAQIKSLEAKVEELKATESPRKS